MKDSNFLTRHNKYCKKREQKDITLISDITVRLFLEDQEFFAKLYLLAVHNLIPFK